MTVHRGGSFLVWLGTPPLVSLPILILLVSSGVRGEGTPLGLPLWTGIFMGYAALTGGYIGLAWKEDPLGLAAAELLAQGLLVTTLSLALGTPGLFSWTGVALLCTGMILALHGAVQPPAAPPHLATPSLSPSPSPLVAEREIPLDDLVPQIPLPSLLVGEGGLVAAINRELAALLGKPPEEIVGTPASDFFPPEAHQVSLGETTWFLFPRTTPRGTLMILSPQPEMEAPASGTGDSYLDSETGLYTEAHSRRRGEEEIERARRYRRWLAVVLLKLEYESLVEGPLPPKEQKDAYGKFVQVVFKTIRTCDMAFRMRDDCVLLFLPETPSSGARTLYNRVKAGVSKILDEAALTPFRLAVAAGFAFYGGNGTTEYGKLLEEVYSNLARNED